MKKFTITLYKCDKNKIPEDNAFMPDREFTTSAKSYNGVVRAAIKAIGKDYPVIDCAGYRGYIQFVGPFPAPNFMGWDYSLEFFKIL